MPTVALLPGVTAEEYDHFERALKLFVHSSDLPLYKMMAYHLGWVDQNGEPEGRVQESRMYGPLVLAATKAASGEASDAMSYAVAIELLNNFLLVHEDVRNANTERNNRPTIWWSWGPAQAINTGDGMHAMARLSIFEQQQAQEKASDPTQVSTALQSLDRATLQVCEGEFLDISFQERANVGVSEIEGVARRHGALYGAAAKLGGIAACANDKVLGGFEHFGTALGTAHYLNIDLKAMWPKTGMERNEVQRGRIQSKIKSLAVAHAIENGSPSTRRRLGEIFMKRLLDPSDINELAKILESTDSKSFAESRVDDAIHKGIAALEVTGLSVGNKDSLADCAKSIVESV